MASKTADELFDEHDSADAMFEAEGGAEGGAEGASKPYVVPERHPYGSPVDAAKEWANKAALGAGPQLEGLLAMVAQDAKNLANGEPLHPKVTPVEAYKAVRDEGAKEHEKSGDTWWGKFGGLLGTASTPIPVKALPKGAGALAKAKQGLKVGTVVGGAHGAVNSKVDLTDDGGGWEKFASLLKDTGAGAFSGGLGGTVVGGALGAVEKPLRSTAETQALRAAGLRGGINNQLRKELGVANMDEARQLGRDFLDEGLIPPIGSSEAVAKRAEALQRVAGNAKGSTLAQAQASGVPADYAATEAATRAPILDPKVTTALERNRAAGKALQYADDIAEQGALTPGDWKMLDQTKSKAWRSANFEADPKLSPEMYRQAVGRSAGDIERQVGNALGPEAQKTFAEANRRYGVGADAVKLAENASTRDAAKKALGMPEVLAALAGSTAGGAAGHAPAGALGGLALALGAKGLDKYGHSTASRFADFLANEAAENTGGGVGGQLGAEAWARFLEPDDDDATASQR